MKILILTRENSERSRAVTEFVDNIRRRYPDKMPEIVDLDTRAGAEYAQVYGAVDYPVILTLSDGGILRNMWEGVPLPLVDEVVSSTLG